MISGLVLERHDRSNAQAQSCAMKVMDRAFDPAFGEAWTASQLAGIMALQGTWLTLAKLDAATLGFCLTRSIFDEAELLLLAVDQGWRGRGIGSSLIRDCLTVARGRGIKSVHLEVRATNNAVQLYNKSGFNHVNTRRDYYRGADGQLYDAMSLRLDL
ncbi:ribosomal-protein-alanine N-acetyltransferase [Sphingobium sp. SCG-1]|uniref:ribosomal protein S18-alanine N-acetyltransferase n=1 Tax=Sphingobium sp. SCG-1 TaxID=2072936 RepID=UPI000CD67D61|nr:ribosomal protein S18-alanine N-acetyltransferase [Sphingobium sp. SCG-1]AUW58679.1 ribosomal-protein-alanine N-acetyltransferase [Sphingobium sp. SCG-1]